MRKSIEKCQKHLIAQKSRIYGNGGGNGAVPAIPAYPEPNDDFRSGYAFDPNGKLAEKTSNSAGIN
ncbi:hypothetical protein ANCCAN_21459 [Ancylostoma caninum]|uniref:Uncharacterized protein n=1 Tax=Ancylostoma caninum TaxID=29170 RepID=A0A368FPG5_ANCCA|nr:hypothetical protein ANCCAN_21459 [Ancylostoma caninum]